MVAAQLALSPQPGAPGSSGAELTIAGVSHAFDLEGRPLPVLDDIDLDIKAGEFVALLGPSGCGKSTLLKLVAGIEQPSQGRIAAEDE